ncbi:MAG TPA: NCS2 family permease [Alphaproteobacteria bacterium]|nr:NCS2 family permease [Alphaproteobacteria bacterium]
MSKSETALRSDAAGQSTAGSTVALLERQFRLNENGTSVRIEILAGITTFLTMAYIIFVNPSILSVTGMDPGALFVATCLAAAFGSAMMGLVANYPIALAPGMGLNAYFAFGVVKGLGFSWEAALGAVFISGVLFLILSVLPVREWIINAIPKSLKMAISAGIGLFLGIIALQAAGIVVDHPATLVTLGSLHAPTTILAAIGFFLMVALDRLRVPGAIIIAILATAVAGILLGHSEFKGIFSVPPSLAPTFFAMDLSAALDAGLIAIIFTFLFVDLFDNTGTLIGVAHRAGLIGPDGRIPRLGRALISDSSAAMVGAALGTSTTTSYIESAAGVKAGGRTGLTAVVVALLFLAALFLSPLANTIPAYATAPALLYVACLMTRGLAEIDWEDATEFVPAVVTAIAMPLTYSIAHGIAFGFIAYAAIKLLSGRFRDLNAALAILAALFVIKFAWLG